MEELHNFNSKQEIVKKKLLGFYTYLALVVGGIFAIYEILTYLVMNIITFIKNLF
jgi:hypothetical protein